MTPRDIVAAVSVAVVWGLVFIAIKVGVGETSPLMLGAAVRIRSRSGGLSHCPAQAPAWKVASMAS